MKYLVTITGFETRNDVIFYKITINGLHNSKVIYKRYSDLRALNDQLIEKNHEFKLKLNLPKFPKKKLFGRTKHSEPDIVTRVIIKKNSLGIRVAVILGNHLEYFYAMDIFVC